MNAVTQRVLDRLEKARSVKEIQDQNPGMIVIEPVPGLFVIHEDIRKPWEPGGPSVVPEPRPPQHGEKSAVLPPKKHPIEEEMEERKKIDDFWDSFKK